MQEITDSCGVSGRIIKSTGGLYRVLTADGEIFECRAKGTFRKEKITPLAGDMVTFRKSDQGESFITEILPRKNSLIRPAAANIDMLILVIAAAHPDPDIFILDKLTAISAFNGIETALVVNKCDIGEGEDIRACYEKAGIPTFLVSASHAGDYGETLERIRALARGKVCFFSGASGVGKSSLLNALYPGFCLATGEISRKIARGKHTTRVTELFTVEKDTYIGDTPGFSMVDVVGFNLLTLDGLLGSFPDIEKYAVGCRYSDCTHTCEDGCKVLEAMEEGLINPSRHDSFIKLYKELRAAKRCQGHSNYRNLC